MIVLVIVAILLAIAYPSYVQYASKAKRGDAQQLLLNWSINQEIWRSNHISYAAEGDLAFPTIEHYQFDTGGSDPTATAYTLRAVAQGDQLNDKARDGTICSPLTMNQNGVKSPPACWE